MLRVVPAHERLDPRPRRRTIRKRLRRIGRNFYGFDYDAPGRITRLVDQNLLSTTIERDAIGIPTAIVGPHGQRLTLSIDANGNLATTASSTGLNNSFAFTNDGLLQAKRNNRGASDSLMYDVSGHANGVGQGMSLSMVPLPFGSQLNISTAEGLGVKLTYGRDLTGVKRTTRTTGGVQTTVLTFPDGSTETQLPDGSTIRESSVADPE